MPATRVRRLVGEPVEALAGRGTEVVRALAPLAGDRRLAAFAGGWSLHSPLLVTADPLQVHEEPAARPGHDLSLLEVLDAPLALTRDARAPAGAVGGGWVTLLGHALGRRTGRVRGAVPPLVGPALPTVSLALADHLLRWDGERWWAEALDAGDGVAVARARALAGEAVRGLAALEGSGALRHPAGAGARDVVAPDARTHMRAVEEVVHAIRAGQIAQANVCSRFSLRLADGRAAAVAAWCALADGLRPDRAALVTGPWGALVGASPETYLGWEGPEVVSAPIKGTRPAGDVARLAASAKDSSENVMIVDLVRNDLARVCEPGSVRVDDLLAVQRHTGVEHLVSRVRGTVRAGTGAGAVVAATFPPGSVTGTPKQRASEVTDAVETAARGAHTGAVGLLGPRLAQLAVTIRTLEVAPDGTAALGVGGGVVADSTPAEEWHEVLTKAAPLLRALGADPVVPDATTAATKGLADPSAGLLETLLVVAGRGLEVADHVGRLRRSWWELTGQGLPADLEARVAAAAAAAGPGWHRLRLLCRGAGPGDGRDEARGDGAVVTLAVEPAPVTPPVPSQPGLVLVGVAAPPHGAERHKLADRTWLDEARSAALAGDRAADDAVLVDPVDGLLETTRDCLLAVLPGQVLRTPALDGRLLPGVTRQVVLDLADEAGWSLERAPLSGEVLGVAEGLVAVNALRGVRWVREVRAGPGDAPTGSWAEPAHGVVALDRLLRQRRRL